ncbi:MAG: Spo0E family sporulation regulatory protein-aspartic acid phosphatase [Clostridiales bacterium]|nr:Spo0E family sporulation regulatory protein-aspartic acid phosphatase [Clostridiales bacterium]
MTLAELKGELEKQRELLTDILRKKDMDMQDDKVLALSRSLDKLIATYLEMTISKTDKY